MSDTVTVALITAGSTIVVAVLPLLADNLRVRRREQRKDRALRDALPHMERLLDDIEAAERRERRARHPRRSDGLPWPYQGARRSRSRRGTS